MIRVKVFTPDGVLVMDSGINQLLDRVAFVLGGGVFYADGCTIQVEDDRGFIASETISRSPVDEE